MNRTRRFIYNSMSTGIYQIVSLVVYFIMPRILLQSYGSEINGLVSSITQFITYFNLAEAGLAGAATYSLYRPLADKNYKAINGIISAAKKFYTKSGIVFTGLVLILSVIYPLVIAVENMDKLSVMCLVAILGAKGFLDFFTLSKYRVLLTADQKTYVISIASSAYVIINFIIISVLASLHFNVVIVYALAIIALFARSIILMVYVKIHYKYINFKEEPDNHALDSRWDVLYLQLLTAVQAGAPTIIATFLLNLKQVSIYSIYNMVIMGITGILSIFISSLSDSFGDILARKEIGLFKRSYEAFEFIFYNIITVVYSVSFIMLLPFIRLYTRNITDANYDVPFVGFLFVLNGLLYCLKTPQGMMVISAGLYKKTRLQSTIQALIIILVGLILTPILGLSGILIGLCASNFYRDIDLLFFIPKQIQCVSWKKTLLRWTRIFAYVLCSCFPFIYFEIKPVSYMQWVLYSITITVWSIIIIGIGSILCEKDSSLDLYRRIKRIIRKD